MGLMRTNAGADCFLRVFPGCAGHPKMAKVQGPLAPPPAAVPGPGSAGARARGMRTIAP